MGYANRINRHSPFFPNMKDTMSVRRISVGWISPQKSLVQKQDTEPKILTEILMGVFA